MYFEVRTATAAAPPAAVAQPPLLPAAARLCRTASPVAPAGHQKSNKKSRRKTYGFVRVGGGTRTHDIQNHNLTL